jgi:hypothetical protein
MNLTDLLKRRSALAAQSAELSSKTAAISAELERVDRELFARMKSLVVAIEGDQPGIGVAASSSAPQYSFGTPTAINDRPAGRASKLAPAILDTMRAAARPVTRNELFAMMNDRGIIIPGKDPKANLSAHLSYIDGILRTEDGRWTLIEVKTLEERQTPA